MDMELVKSFLHTHAYQVAELLHTRTKSVAIHTFSMNNTHDYFSHNFDFSAYTFLPCLYNTPSSCLLLSTYHLVQEAMERVARLAVRRLVPLQPTQLRREHLSNQVVLPPRQRHGLDMTGDQVC